MLPKVMINPSCQYGNVIRDDHGRELYNEGLVAYEIAERVKAVLDASSRVTAYLSRDGRDAPSDLAREIALTNRLGCDLLVAIHTDASHDPAAGGTWTFYRDERGRALADAVHNAVLAKTRQVYPEVHDRGIREHWHRLKVLWESECPACLTEILFHTHAYERGLLLDAAYRQRVAEGFAEGILTHLDGDHKRVEG